MEEINRIKIEIKAVLENVAIVRVAISSFISTLDITIDELMDIKTAISEAVTNSIEHGYDEVDDLENKCVIVKAYIYSDNDDVIKIEIEDKGVGIEDIETAMLPTYTSKPELEHAGMGFTIMESFMDEMKVESILGIGTKVTMKKMLEAQRSNLCMK